MAVQAMAFWLREPGVGEIRPLEVSDPGPGEVLVRTLRSAVSRGTETLVFRGGVPPDQYAAMRAPFQEGDFPGPLKYGYLNVGVVEKGPPDLVGRTVFCLYPHQTAYVVPASAVVVVPEDVPAARAVLAGTVETAVNALWDAAPLLGDRVTVVGGGMVGLCVARLLVGVPGLEVTVVDVDPERATVVGAIGAHFALPAEAEGGTRPRRPRQRLLCRAPAVTGPAVGRGNGRRAQLVRRRRGEPATGRHLPLGSPVDPGEPGRGCLPDPEGSPDDHRPRSARPAPSSGPGVRRPGDRQLGIRRSPGDPAAPRGRQPSGAVPHDHLRREVGPCSA